MVAAFTAFYISQLELTQMCVINCENNNGYFAVRLMARVDYGAPVRCYTLMKQHSLGFGVSKITNVCSHQAWELRYQLKYHPVLMKLAMSKVLAYRRLLMYVVTRRYSAQ